MWIESVLEYSKTELELLGLNHVGLDTVVIDFIKGLHTKLGNQPGDHENHNKVRRTAHR